MAYFRCGGGGIPATLKSNMDSVLNKKFGTISQDYPPNEWADDVNLLGKLPERTASGTIAHFNDGADLVPLKSCEVTVTPSQSGTGDPSPTNPRPLNSFSSLTVEHTGKNMFTSENAETPAYINSSGTIQTGAGANGWALSDYIEVKEGATYYFNPNSTSGTTAKHAYFDSSKTFVSAINSGEGSFTVPSGIKYMRFSYRTSSTNIQLEVGSTATTYEEYRTPDPHTLALGSTVYGLTGDCVTGEFEEPYEVVTLDGTETTWESSSSYDFRVQIPTMKNGDSLDGLAEWLKTWKNSSETNPSVRFGANTNYLYFYHIIGNIEGITGVANWKTYLANHPLKIAYPPATPTALTIDPVEVESFKGVNNIWCDKDNSSVAVEYRADIDLLISELGG